jgi:hypothetical protein
VYTNVEDIQRPQTGGDVQVQILIPFIGSSGTEHQIFNLEDGSVAYPEMVYQFHPGKNWNFWGYVSQ